MSVPYPSVIVTPPLSILAGTVHHQPDSCSCTIPIGADHVEAQSYTIDYVNVPVRDVQRGVTGHTTASSHPYRLSPRRQRVILVITDSEVYDIVPDDSPRSPGYGVGTVIDTVPLGVEARRILTQKSVAVRILNTLNLH